MNVLFEAAKEICDFMAAQKWEFCIIGGLAVQRWGEPRTTLDADFTLLANWEEEEPYVNALLRQFESRISDGHAFALSHRVLLLQASNGCDVDVVLGALPFEVEMVKRAKKMEFAPNINLPCCTAEDLIIMKAFAGRPRDWNDTESIALRQSGLDEEYITTQLAELCALKDTPENVERAKKLLEEHK